MTTKERVKRYKNSLELSCRQVRLMLIVLAAAASFMGFFSFMLLGGTTPTDNALLSLFSVTFALLCSGGVVLLPIIFRELYSKPVADTVYSLPLSSNERFLAKLWIIGEYHLLPVVCTAVLVGISAVVFCGGNTWASGMIVRYLLVMVIEAAFADAACLLFINFCGSLLCCIYVPAAATVLLSLAPMLVVGCYRYFSGIYAFSTEPQSDVLNSFGVSEIVRSFFDSHYIDAPDSSILALMLIEPVLAVVFTLLALAVYGRRNGLQAGKPFANGFFYTVFICFAVIAGFAAGLRNRALFAAVIYGVGAGLIVAATRYRKRLDLHELCVTLVHCAAAMAGATAAVFLVYITYGFGGGHARPENYVVDNCHVEFHSNEQYFQGETSWYLDYDEVIRRGSQREAATAIFEELSRLQAVKPRHTVSDFPDFFILGRERYTPDIPRSETAAFTLECLGAGNYKDRYYYFSAVIRKDQVGELFAALEARGVPLMNDSDVG